MSEDSEEQYFDTVYFDVIEFLAEYEKHRCLWDRNHEHFKERKIRIRSEENLGEKLGIPELRILRRKIRSVRGTYNTEIRKIKSSLESGDKVYIPKLSWFPLADRFLRATTDLPHQVFPLMDFDDISSKPKKLLLQKYPRTTGIQLLAVPKNKKRQKLLDGEGFNHDDEKTDDETFEEYEELESLNQEDLRDDNSNVKLELPDDYDTDNVEQIENHSSVYQPAPQTSGLNVVVKYLKHIASSSENEFAAFGRSIGVQLQNLPLELAVQLQTDIQAHITKTRLEYLQRNKKKSSEKK